MCMRARLRSLVRSSVCIHIHRSTVCSIYFQLCQFFLKISWMFSNAMKSSLVRTGRKSPPNRAFRRRIPSLRPGPWLPGRRQEEEARGGRQREGGGGWRNSVREYRSACCFIVLDEIQSNTQLCIKKRWQSTRTVKTDLRF